MTAKVRQHAYGLTVEVVETGYRHCRINRTGNRIDLRVHDTRVRVHLAVFHAKTAVERHVRQCAFAYAQPSVLHVEIRRFHCTGRLTMPHLHVGLIQCSPILKVCHWSGMCMRSGYQYMLAGNAGALGHFLAYRQNIGVGNA